MKGVAVQRPPVLALRTDWQWRGACRDEDPELFYAPDGRNSRAVAGWVQRAKAVCKPCRTWRPCLTAALDRAEQGVWGGLTEGERDVLLNLHGGDVGRAVAAEALRRGDGR